MKEDIYVFAQYVRPEREANVPIAGVSYCDATYCIERSDYDSYVIEYTVAGEGVLEVDGQKYDIHAGDTYFLYKRKGHRYYCKNNSWTKLWVVISGEVAEALFHAYLKSRPNVLHGFEIGKSMEAIIALAGNKTLSYEEMVDEIIVKVHEILISAKAFSEKEARSACVLSKSMKNYIDENLNKALKLEELSRIFNYSRNHLINVFREEYGITPYAYYEKQRMLMAGALLKNTSISVSDISGKLGFENPQCFSKRFKAYFKIAPTLFRHQYR